MLGIYLYSALSLYSVSGTGWPLALRNHRAGILVIPAAELSFAPRERGMSFHLTEGNRV